MSFVMSDTILTVASVLTSRTNDVLLSEIYEACYYIRLRDRDKLNIKKILLTGNIGTLAFLREKRLYVLKKKNVKITQA